MGRQLAEVVLAPGPRRQQLDRCTRPYDGLASRTRINEQAWYLSDGTELLVTARILRDGPRGPVRQVAVSLRSARARKRLDRERSDLVATVAHELRSPLTGVKGFVATLLSKWDKLNDDQKKMMLETVNVDADRLTRLIAELLDVARIDTGRLSLYPRPVDFEAAVDRVVASVRAGTGREIAFTVDGELPSVSADPDKFAQVVTNLVDNAIRHGDGQVTLTATPIDGEASYDGVLLHVDDEGDGISPDIRSRVFTKFWKHGTRGGSGLGMYIIHGLVQAHGGSVEIDDSPAGGARVSILWPERGQPPASNRFVGPGSGFLDCALSRTPPGRQHMSGPNSEYDPVEVTPLKADEVEAMREAALAAIAAAADLDGLKRARTEHAGDRSPLALANREIGALPPQARKDAGMRVGKARGAVNQALAARQAELEAEHEARMLVEETVDVTLPWDRRPAGRPAPAHHPPGARRRRVRGDGLGGRRGPRGGGRVAELRRAQPRPGPPGADHAGHLLAGAGRRRPGDAHAHLARAGPHHARAQAADLRGLPRPGVPHRRARRHAHPGVLPGRGAGRSTRASRWPTSRAPWTTSPRRCSATASRRGSGRRTSRSPSPPPRSTWSASCAAGWPRPWRPAGPARARAGSSGAAAAWSTRACSPPAASTARPTPASPSAWASSGP